MNGKTNEIEIRHNILSIIDPYRANLNLSILPIEELYKILENKTNKLNDITHKQYFDIYDNNLLNSDSEISFMLNKLRIKELDLLCRENKILKKEKELEIDNEENEENGEICNYNSSYQSYSSKSSSMMTGKSISPTLSTSIVSPIKQNLIDEELLRVSKHESEDEALRMLDTPEAPEEIKIDKKSKYTTEMDRPESSTDELLDIIHDIFSTKDKNKIKSFFTSSDLPISTIQWINRLKYKGSTFKQLLISDVENISKILEA
jgi:hypothetical protein